MNDRHPALTPPSPELAYKRVKFTHPKPLRGCFLALWGELTTPDMNHPLYPSFEADEGGTPGGPMLVHVLRIYDPGQPTYGEIAWTSTHGELWAIRGRGLSRSMDEIRRVNTWLGLARGMVRGGRPPGSGRFTNPSEFLDEVARAMIRIGYEPGQHAKAESVACDILLIDNSDSAVRSLRKYARIFHFDRWDNVVKAAWVHLKESQRHP